MTRATYNTDNTLTEISDYGPPPDKPNSKFYSTGQREMYQRHTEAWRIVMQDYNANKEQYEKTLRTLVCSPECRGLWKPGQEVVEGRDYEVRKCIDPGNCLLEVACVTCKPVAFPLPVKSDDDLWYKAIDLIMVAHDKGLSKEDAVGVVKSQFIITKR